MNLILLKTESPFVEGIVGHDFKLSFWKRLQILFSSGVSVVFVSSDLHNVELR